MTILILIFDHILKGLSGHDASSYILKAVGLINTKLDPMAMMTPNDFEVKSPESDYFLRKTTCTVHWYQTPYPSWYQTPYPSWYSVYCKE
jgi:hypothetical protein